MAVMAKSFKEGDRVRILTRPVSPEDRKENRYFDHMAGLTGTVENVFAHSQIAVKVDLSTLNATAKDVHLESQQRMRKKFQNEISEEQKKKLTPEDLNFDSHYMILAQASDLKRIS